MTEGAPEALPPWRRHLDILVTSGRQFLQDGGLAFAGHLAFLAMLALFPFLIFLLTIAGEIGQTDRGLEAAALLLGILPPEVAAVIDGPFIRVTQNANSGILTTSALFALWTAASGLEAARAVLIKAYGHEYAPALWRRRLESMVVILVAVIVILASMSMMVAGPPIIFAAREWLPDILDDGLLLLWGWLRLAITPGMLLLGLYLIYLTLTPRRAGKAYRLPGCLLALVVFMAAAKGLSLYLQTLGRFDAVYGSLAGVVSAQVFCYLIAAGFVGGAYVNAGFTAERQRGTIPSGTAPTAD